jgi:formamidopyrimidine-DNA glycosylase
VPELPEVETVRRGIERGVLGRTVRSIAVTGARTVRRQGADELRARLTDRRFESAVRRGKYLALGLDDGSALVVHLRMSGQLLHVTDAGQAMAPHTHVVVRLDDGSELRFVDPRTFGEMYVSDEVGEDGLPVELARLGVDPIVDGLTGAQLARILAGRRSPLKVALTDQRLIAGIGNIYADEICFRARVRPDRRSATIERPEATRIAKATLKILSDAIEARGSSLRDARYRDVSGDLGNYQDRHAVYGRAGLACRRCGNPIVGVRISGRSSCYCGHCQR